MKIVITESQLQELFDSTNVYEVEMVSREDYPDESFIRYIFTTKDNLKYRILLGIREDKIGKIDFDVVGPGVFSYIDLINKYDAIKVLNTIKSIIEKHKSEIDTLIINSTAERILFYKKLLKYMNIPYNGSENAPYEDPNSRTILAHLNPTTLNENTYKVYHGTNEKFSKFDFKKATQGIVWFTDNIDSIKNQEHGGQGNKYIMTRYITINNPAGWEEYEKYGLQQLEDMGYDGVILPQEDKTDYFVFYSKNISAKEPKDFI